MKQKKLIFNFFVNRNWKKLTDSRKRSKILADNRKSHHPIETLILFQDKLIPMQFHVKEHKRMCLLLISHHFHGMFGYVTN